ncbi:hypothetical protein [Thioalkalivibrio sp. HK1]|nr:hypothetical protein [Thioalkalivibrio sp. HK1]
MQRLFQTTSRRLDAHGEGGQADDADKDTPYTLSAMLGIARWNRSLGIDE